MAATNDKILWSDRKRYFGLPISFTKYEISDDRLFRTTGLLNLNYEEILLYRVRDLELSRSFGQRIFGVGTICVHSGDQSTPHMDLVNIKHPREVKELIHQQVEEMKLKRRVRVGEIMGNGFDDDGDGEPDEME